VPRQRKRRKSQGNVEIEASKRGKNPKYNQEQGYEVKLYLQEEIQERKRRKGSGEVSSTQTLLSYSSRMPLSWPQGQGKKGKEGA